VTVLERAVSLSGLLAQADQALLGGTNQKQESNLPVRTNLIRLYLIRLYLIRLV
jgi:hypothetical protein